MSFDAEKLYRLLPAIHRLRDQNAMGTLANNPTPLSLEQLVGVIADQVAVLEEELEQLYDNQFVETAALWTLPYLGDLLGLRGIEAEGLDKRFAPRAEVANTIAYRRRKGTAAMLEQLARDVSGQPAAGVEFWKRLATTQHVNHVRRGNVVWASLRNTRQLEFVGTPFEEATRAVEVRRIEPGLGKWNIPNIGLFIWRLRDYSRTRAPLTVSQIPRHFRLHPLGLDAALCAKPETEIDIAHLAEPKNVPMLLTWRQLAGDPVTGAPNQFHPNEAWYGSSITLFRKKPMPLAPGEDPFEEIPAREIVVCNLHDVPALPIAHWGHDNFTLPNGTKPVLLDPVRGRVVLPREEEVFATFSTLFPADLGGGEYARTSSFAKSSAPARLVAQQRLANPPAMTPALTIKAALNLGTAASVIIEVVDSGYYPETLDELNASDVAIELRAKDGCWPTLILDQPWIISGNDAGSVLLNGFLMSGQNIQLDKSLGLLGLRHCTLLPRLNIGVDGLLNLSASRPDALDATKAGAKIELENCIIGPLRVSADANVSLRNCIVDAGARDAWAISGKVDGNPAGHWRIENCTIIGRTALGGLELASNTIFYGNSIAVERRQEGCVRFCWLPDDAVVPRRHKCVPRSEPASDGSEVVMKDGPQFVSLRYGNPSYCQLRRSCADMIRRGADDGSEMGVYHDLLEPPRESHLCFRLRDYLRFGLEAGIFYEQQTPRIIEQKNT